MAGHDHSTPLQPATRGRRSTATPPRKPQSKRNIAGVPEYAALEFEALPPDKVSSLKDRERFRGFADAVWISMAITADAFGSDQDTLAAKRCADQKMLEAAHECLAFSIERCRTLANLFEGADMRLLAAAARHLVATCAA